jgi:hypothetical protein
VAAAAAAIALMDRQEPFSVWADMADYPAAATEATAKAYSSLPDLARNPADSAAGVVVRATKETCQERRADLAEEEVLRQGQQVAAAKAFSPEAMAAAATAPLAAAARVLAAQFSLRRVALSR